MSTEQNTHDFSFTTSCEYWEEKTYEEIKKSTYLNPLYDPGFKAFLGDEEALKSFLNAALRLGGDHRIDAVVIKNVEINIVFPNTKTFRLDIRATTADGRCIDVEMQKAKPAHFIERVLLQHSAFLLQSKYEQDKDFLDNFPNNPSDKERKEREDRFYMIPSTIAIWLCDFHVEGQAKYRGAWKLKNERGLPVTEKIEYIMYDLTLFKVLYEEIRTDEHRWLYLLKHAGTSENLPDFGNRVYANAIKRILVKNASEKLLREQAHEMVWTEEELDHLAAMRERAREEGLEKGREQERVENQADTEVVLRDMGIAQDKIAEMQARLEALRQSRLAQK